MRLMFFTVPIHDDGSAAESLNRALASHRIAAVDRRFLEDGSNSAWVFCLSVEPVSGDAPASARRRDKVDYREVLDEREFAVFARLRALRKTLAEREGVPPYALFTNEQLAEMVRRGATSREALRDIPGIGDARVQKYAEAVLAALREAGPPVVPADGEADEA